LLEFHQIKSLALRVHHKKERIIENKISLALRKKNFINSKLEFLIIDGKKKLKLRGKYRSQV
jgi:hypothetical protein